MSIDPRKALLELQQRYDSDKAPLISAVQDIERQEAEKRLADEDAERARRWSEADAIAKKLYATSVEIDRLAHDLGLRLAERRSLAEQITAVAPNHPGAFGHVFHHRKPVSGSLGHAGIGEYADLANRSDRKLADHDLGFLSKFGVAA